MAFAPILDQITSFKFIGFSFFETVFPAFILIFLYFKNFKLIKKSHHLLLAFNIAFFLLIILSRYALYGEFSEKTLGGQTYVFLLPVCIILFKKFRISKSNRRILKYLFASILIFNFAISLLYILGLPTIQIVDTNSPDYSEFGRFTGIMGGANVQGNFIYLIFMIYALGPFNLNIYKLFILFTISLITVLPTLSKNSMFGIIFIFIYSVYQHFRTSNQSANIIFIFATFFIIVLFTTWLDLSAFNSFYNSLIARLNYDAVTGERLEKLNYSIITLISDVNHMIIGIPTRLQDRTFISISDNSLTLLLAGFGIPFTLFFFLFLIYLIRNKFNISIKFIIYTFLILVVLLTNNAILWLPWVSYTILGYCLLKHDVEIVDSDK